jgi:hypothetical protein
MLHVSCACAAGPDCACASTRRALRTRAERLQGHRCVWADSALRRLDALPGVHRLRPGYSVSVGSATHTSRSQAGGTPSSSYLRVTASAAEVLTLRLFVGAPWPVKCSDDASALCAGVRVVSSEERPALAQCAKPAKPWRQVRCGWLAWVRCGQEESTDVRPLHLQPLQQRVLFAVRITRTVPLQEAQKPKPPITRTVAHSGGAVQCCCAHSASPLCSQGSP